MLQRAIRSSTIKRSTSFLIQRNHLKKTERNRFITPFLTNTQLQSSLTGGDAVSSSRRPFKSPKDAPDDSKVNKSNQEEELHWNKLGLMSEIADTVKSSLGYKQPTPIQKMSIPRLLSKEHIAFAAATGSGKTLAYLLPVIHSLKSEELLQEQNSTFVLRKPKRPRAVILAPTRELVEQIVHVIKSLSHGIKISSASLVGGEDAGKQRRKLESSPIDILVATPGRFVKRLRDGHMYIGSVRYIVIDEIDTMLENGFQGDIDVLLKGVNNRKEEDDTQVVVTTATMTKAVRRILDLEGGTSSLNKKNTSTLNLPKTLRFIEAPGLHRAVPRLNQVFIDVGNTDKLSLLLDVVHSSYSSQQKEEQPKTLIFCNTISSCRAVEHALTEAGISCLSYHGDLGSTMRNENVQVFKSSPFQNTLICTDIASRGLDIPAIEHIVMFDFPLNPIDYLHRSGRTARGTSGVGKVTALIAKRDKVLAMAIEQAVLSGMPLDSLSSRKSDYSPGAKSGTATRNSSFKKKSTQSNGRTGSSAGKTPVKVASGRSGAKSNSGRRRTRRS